MTKISPDFAKELSMMSQEVGKKPVPDVRDIDQGFWDGVQEGKFLLQKCLECNHLQFFPRAVCVNCFGMNLGWEESKGTGVVYSFTLVRVPRDPVLRKQVQETGIPIVFAAVDLDEGVRILGEITGCEPEEIKLGARVKMAFEEVEGTNFKLPKFRLIG